MLNKLGCHAHFEFSANQITWSSLLIQIYILNDKQCRSRSQLIWIYTVCKGRINPGSAGQGLIRSLIILLPRLFWDSQPSNMHTQLRLKSACAFAVWLRVRCLHEEILYPKMCPVKILIRLVMRRLTCMFTGHTCPKGHFMMWLVCIVQNYGN